METPNLFEQPKAIEANSVAEIPVQPNTELLITNPAERKELLRNSEAINLREHDTIFNNRLVLNTAYSMAEMLSRSDIVPAAFQGKPANCLIAMEIANRMKVTPLAVLQNLIVIHGRPSFFSAFVATRLTESGAVSEWDYEWKDMPISPAAKNLGITESKACRVIGTDAKSGKVKYGTWITIDMAIAEGWYGKAGSKWKTMPDQMLMYRAVAFFQRAHYPGLMMGYLTEDEARDIAVDSATKRVQGKTINIGEAIKK